MNNCVLLSNKKKASRELGIRWRCWRVDALFSGSDRSLIWWLLMLELLCTFYCSFIRLLCIQKTTFWIFLLPICIIFILVEMEIESDWGHNGFYFPLNCILHINLQNKHNPPITNDLRLIKFTLHIVCLSSLIEHKKFSSTLKMANLITEVE